MKAGAPAGRKIRGAEELASHWAGVPVARGALVVPPGLTFAAVLDAVAVLKHALLGERCAHAGEVCADRNLACRQPALCTAHALQPGWHGGARSWMMATLGLRWLPQAGRMQISAWGHRAIPELGWAMRRLRERTGWALAETWSGTFGDTVRAEPGLYRLTFLTPPMLGKRGVPFQGEPTVAPEAMQAVVQATLSARSHKLSGLIDANAGGQRLAGHLARRVARDIAGDGLRLVSLEVTACLVEAASASTRRGPAGEGAPGAGRFEALSCDGSLLLEVQPDALPWLSLLAEFGVGENTDEGFGMVEVQRA